MGCQSLLRLAEGFFFFRVFIFAGQTKSSLFFVSPGVCLGIRGGIERDTQRKAEGRKSAFAIRPLEQDKSAKEKFTFTHFFNAFSIHLRVNIFFLYKKTDSVN